MGGEVWRGEGEGEYLHPPLPLVPQFVASGSRFRLYFPKDTCLVNFLLAGVSCPRAGQSSRAGETIPGEPWGDEGLTFSKELILQREVSGATGEVGGATGEEDTLGGVCSNFCACGLF